MLCQLTLLFFLANDFVLFAWLAVACCSFLSDLTMLLCCPSGWAITRLPRAGAIPGCPLQLPLHLTLSLAVLSRTTPQAHACWRNPPFRRNGLRPSPFLAGLSSRRPGRYRTRHRCASYLEPFTVSLQLETPGPRYSLCFCRSCALRALELSRDHLLHSSCSKRPPSPPRILVPAERSNVTQRDDRRRINFCRPHVVGASCSR